MSLDVRVFACPQQSLTPSSPLFCLHQVPPTRRYSHDETDMWTSGQMPSYLHRWGSTEDIIGIQQYSSSRHHHERRRGSLVSYHEEGGHYRKRRRSEDSGYALRGLPRVAVLSSSCGSAAAVAGMYADRHHEDDFLKCFGRDEVISFIDETPLASPMKSPHRRASAVSLLPQAFETLPPRGGGNGSGAGQHAVILYPHFPLTNFEREPQALRRLSDHGRGCALTELPQDHGGRDAGGVGGGSRRASRADSAICGSSGEAGNGSAGCSAPTGSCGSGKGCALRDSKCVAGQDPGPHGTATQQAPEQGPHSPSHRHRTGPGEGGGSWEAEQKLLTKMESKGSTNSFISSPSASSSGYVTFHSDSVGSAT